MCVREAEYGIVELGERYQDILLLNSVVSTLSALCQTPNNWIMKLAAKVTVFKKAEL